MIFYVDIAARFFLSDGRKKVLASMRDVSEHVRVEEERRRLEEQLQQSQKLESVGRLAGGVAHDFNNMLGVILGYAEMALEHAPPSHLLRADLNEIRSAATRSSDLTRQLLTFARKQTILPKVLNLNETVVGTLGLMKRLIGETAASGVPRAICGHRPVLPLMLEALGVPNRPMLTAAVLVAHLSPEGETVSVEWHKPRV